VVVVVDVDVELVDVVEDVPALVVVVVFADVVVVVFLPGAVVVVVVVVVTGTGLPGTERMSGVISAPSMLR